MVSGRADTKVCVASVSQRTLPSKRETEGWRKLISLLTPGCHACTCVNFRGKTMGAAPSFDPAGSSRHPHISACSQSSGRSLLGCLGEKFGDAKCEVLTCLIHDGGADLFPAKAALRVPQEMC